MHTMIPRTNHSRTIPILIWKEERATKIPIIRLPPRRAPLGRWPRPLNGPWSHKRFIFLNRHGRLRTADSLRIDGCPFHCFLT